MNLTTLITGQTARAGGVTIHMGLEGLEELDALLEQLSDPEPMVSAALFAEAEEIMGEAKLLTPVETGALRSSGHVQLPERNGTSISVEFGFGGPAIPYALRQHEDMTLHHPVGQAKFLEIPLVDHERNFGERLVHRMRGGAF